MNISDPNIETIRDNRVIPSVIKHTSHGERSFDIYSRLLDDRIITYFDQVDSDTAEVAIAKLLHLDALDNKKPIHLYINSPGGEVISGLALYDTIRSINAPVYGYVLGMAASMGSILISGCDKRFINPNGKIMIHQPSGGARGRSCDIEIEAQEIVKTRDVLTTILAENCGKTFDEVKLDMANTDKWLTAGEAVKYGIVDEIVKPTKGYTKSKSSKLETMILQ